ncbi:hypothetical protein PSP6_200048 [Paraburkholderia tropica]|nr:hypothetical protein PSP6_200048 [Paraburkholderia tropica]
MRHRSLLEADLPKHVQGSVDNGLALFFRFLSHADSGPDPTDSPLPALVCIVAASCRDGDDLKHLRDGANL